MEKYEFLSIDEIIGEEYCVKKIANCQFCQAIYELWTKEKARGKYQSGPTWTGMVRHLESVHNVGIEGEAKNVMSRKTIEDWEGRCGKILVHW